MNSLKKQKNESDGSIDIPVFNFNWRPEFKQYPSSQHEDGWVKVAFVWYVLGIATGIWIGNVIQVFYGR